MKRILTAIALALIPSPPVEAKPPGPKVVCQTFPEAPVCLGAEPSCTFCHSTPPARNAFGTTLESMLLPGVPRPLSDADFVSNLPQALEAAAGVDSDGDGVSNQEEMEAGSFPGDPTSVPVREGCAAAGRCDLDPAYWLRKVRLDFCGEPAGFEELEAIVASPDPGPRIHEVLDSCLNGEYWLGPDGVLAEIAHRKIRPSQAIKSGEGAGTLPLANYDDDYALFIWTQIDHHDARDVLTAQYLVRRRVEGDRTVYEPYLASALEEIQARGIDEAQLVDDGKRAGLLTTRWNLTLNTMFTPIPRTTAAQAYRAFLGLDLAKMEGLADVSGEPFDYDDKGVRAPDCARCHATLDPLSYPFTRYSGFTGGAPFSYVPNRLDRLAVGPDDPLRATPEAGAIFGRPVRDLLEWAEVAANSDAFAQSTVLDYWKRFLGEPPRPTEQMEFRELSQRFMAQHAYSVERMLHDFVDTEAYRAY